MRALCAPYIHVQHLAIAGTLSSKSQSPLYPQSSALWGFSPWEQPGNAACCHRALFLAGNSRDSLRSLLSKTWPGLAAKRMSSVNRSSAHANLCKKC